VPEGGRPSFRRCQSAARVLPSSSLRLLHPLTPIGLYPSSLEPKEGFVLLQELGMALPSDRWNRRQPLLHSSPLSNFRHPRLVRWSHSSRCQIPIHSARTGRLHHPIDPVSTQAIPYVGEERHRRHSQNGSGASLQPLASAASFPGREI